MSDKVRVILITDGDKVAQAVVEEMAESLGLRCISASGGNPTPISGREIVRLLKEAEHDPVLVMFDDRGETAKGRGETALSYVANHPAVEVLGAVAVASNSGGRGVAPDLCVSRSGRLVDGAIDKNGEVKTLPAQEARRPLVKGDTVDVLNEVDVPLVVGVGDIGKMDDRDDLRCGAPITRRAIEEILRQSGAAIKDRYGRLIMRSK